MNKIFLYSLVELGFGTGNDQNGGQHEFHVEHLFEKKINFKIKFLLEIIMGKKGRPKPKAKQTGKKRSHGQKSRKRASASKELRATKGLKNAEHGYFANPSDYEPVRKNDSNEVEDINEEDEDLEVFNQPERDFKFLTANLEKDLKLNKKKRKAIENIEESYEKQPRLAGEEWKPKQHILLPLKDKSGIIRENEKISENGNSDSLAHDTDMLSTTNAETFPDKAEVNENSPENVIPMASLSAVELLEIRQEKINAKKVLITSLVSAILEDPNTNVEKLSEMNQLCEEKDSDVSVTVRKLAIVSQREVFKDIIPGYHIRPLSESEKTAKVSKDVKKVRRFEEGLLNGYQKYLEILEQTAKERKRYKRLNKMDLPMIALNCLCDLFINVPHFNYRTNIMAVLVPMMNDKSANGQVSKLSCQTIHTAFKKDSVGEISLEIVQLISKFVKSQSFSVRPCVLETFLSLRLQDAELGQKDKGPTTPKPKHKNRLDKANKKKTSKNDRKRQKELKKIEHELQEAEAVEGKGKSRKLQTEIIKIVFFIYFRVLKTSGVCPLLAPVLTGLSKYTHLINVDFFADLMSVLKTLIKSEGIFSSDKLHCILTAFKILSGQGEALNIDPQTFYSHLYSTLLNISPVSTDTEVSAALECLDVMLNKRRKQVSIQRLLAYIKRLSTVALQQRPPTALALLACARSFLQMHHKAEIILDGGGSSSGIFRPEIPDPEYANADGTSLWELCTFQRHYEPTLRNVATNISLGSPGQGPGSLPAYLTRKNPLELFEGIKENQQLFGYLNNTSVDRKPKRQKTQHNGIPSDAWFQKCAEKDVTDCYTWMKEQETDVDFAKSFVGCN